MRRRLFYGALAMAFTIGVAACDEKLSDLTGPTPNLEPTFSSIQREIFDTRDSAGRAACTQCHNVVGGRFNGLDLTSTVAYANLVGVASRGNPGAVRVIPGDPEHSYLVRKIEGRDIVGARMPIIGPPYLTDGQILVIRRWIELGARND
jgi:hypothetical protein